MENAQTEKKGMSKGCMVGLIVVSAIVVIVILGGVTCWIYKDELAKKGAVAMVEGMITMIAEKEIEGIDTETMQTISSAFLEKLQTQDSLDWDKYGKFMQAIQPAMADKEIDAFDVETAIGAMVEYFPDLGELLPMEEPVEVDPALEESMY